MASSAVRVVATTSGWVRVKSGAKKRCSAASAMAGIPWARTVSMRVRQTAVSIWAEVQAQTRADTRSGALRARVMAIMPPSDRPQTAARAIPAASIAARASPASSSRL